MKGLGITALFFLVLIEVYSLLPLKGPNETPGTFPTLSGIIHVHSLYSDGGGTAEEIAIAAKEAGHDFVILTDHMSSQARRESEEKNYGGMDLFVEMEASTPAGHCLTFFSHTDTKILSDEVVNELSFEHFIGRDHRPGVFLAIAHPSNVKNPWARFDQLPEGIEVINFDSLWQRQLYDSPFRFAGTLLIYPFNNFLGALRFFQIYRKDFNSWDSMNSLSPPRFGILGHDTHSNLILKKGVSFPWPDYTSMFRLASNILFPKGELPIDFELRKKAIYALIREGRLAMIFSSIHPFPGNDWRLNCQDRLFRSGDQLTFSEGCEFQVTLPQTLKFDATLKLWRNGELYKEVSSSKQATFPLSTSGFYRLEVWLTPHTIAYTMLREEVPYLFYNPIYVQ